MIKGFAILVDPDELTAPAVPVAAMIATGHADVAEFLGHNTGRTGPTGQILDAGMLLEYQVEHPGRGGAAQELLDELGVPAGLLDQLRDLASGRPVSTTDHSRRVHDWAWDMITAPGGMVDRMPELAVPTGDPTMGEKTPEEHAADLTRMNLHLGAVWAIGMLAELVGPDTTALLEEIHRRRAARIAQPKRDRALVGAV